MDNIPEHIMHLIITIILHYKYARFKEKSVTLVISLLNSCIVAATSGAFIRLLTSFMTSALLDKCPTVRAVAGNQPIESIVNIMIRKNWNPT